MAVPLPLADRHLVDGHLVDRHLVDRHLVNRHLVNRHLVNRHLVDKVQKYTYQPINDRGGFVNHLSLTQVAEQSVIKMIHVAIVILVTPKAGAKHENQFDKQTSGSQLCRQTYFRPIGLHHLLDGVTNPEYKLLHFIQLTFFAMRRRHQLLTGIGAAIQRSVYG